MIKIHCFIIRVFLFLIAFFIIQITVGHIPAQSINTAPGKKVLALELSKQQQAQLAEANKLDKEVDEKYRSGDNDEALFLAQKACDLTKKAVGEKHPAYATKLNNLAVLCERLGKYTKAELNHLEALKIRREAQGRGKTPSAAFFLPPDRLAISGRLGGLSDGKVMILSSGMPKDPSLRATNDPVATHRFTLPARRTKALSEVS